MSSTTNIEQIAALEPNWDGAGATPPSRLVINRAMAMLERCDPPTRIAASNSGSILIEWLKMGAYTEVEITDGPVAEWLKVYFSKRTKHWETPFGIEVVQ